MNNTIPPIKLGVACTVGTEGGREMRQLLSPVYLQEKAKAMAEIASLRAARDRLAADLQAVTEDRDKLKVELDRIHTYTLVGKNPEFYLSKICEIADEALRQSKEKDNDSMSGFGCPKCGLAHMEGTPCPKSKGGG